jgi:hypothetical protein
MSSAGDRPGVGRQGYTGGRVFRWIYNLWAGPAQVDNAVAGFSEEARQGWKRDLENRKRYSREQRERRQREREHRRHQGQGG